MDDKGVILTQTENKNSNAVDGENRIKEDVKNDENISPPTSESKGSTAL